MIEDGVQDDASAKNTGRLAYCSSMLPYTALARKEHPLSRGKRDGRNIEIP